MNSHGFDDGVGVPHGRLNWYTPAELSPERRAVYDLIASGPRLVSQHLSPLTDEIGRLEGPFNAMLVSPTLGTALQAVGASIRYSTLLSDREREIAILVCAAHEQSDFEWIAHVRIARAAGVSEDQIRAVRTDGPFDTFDETERAVAVSTRTMLVERDLDDRQFEMAADSLGIVKLVELIALVGYYQTLALTIRTLRVPLPSNSMQSMDEVDNSGLA
jgi:alkylhydroperoxidase family enzyme